MKAGRPGSWLEREEEKNKRMWLIETGGKKKREKRDGVERSAPKVSVVKTNGGIKKMKRYQKCACTYRQMLRVLFFWESADTCKYERSFGS
jgi:hypothetical protein